MEKRNALISVYNKEGIVDFARALIDLGFNIISSGGTAKKLLEEGVPVIDAQEITGMPPILSHRVVTLHPAIHAGLLAEDTPEHRAELEKYNFPWIDLLCVDFYPLYQTIRLGAPFKEVVEKTDIGGPTMVRSAVKGGRIVICESGRRKELLEWLKTGEPKSAQYIQYLGALAEIAVGEYVSMSGNYRKSVLSLTGSI